MHNWYIIKLKIQNCWMYKTKTAEKGDKDTESGYTLTLTLHMDI